MLKNPCEPCFNKNNCEVCLLYTNRVIFIESIIDNLNSNFDTIYNYVNINKLHAEANRIANKVGSTHLAMIYLYNNIAITDEIIKQSHEIIKIETEQRERNFQELLK